MRAPRQPAWSGPWAPGVAAAVGPAPLLVRLMMSLFIIVIYSRLIEIVPVRPLPQVGLALLLYGLLTSRWMDWLTGTPTLLLLALTAWMVPSALVGDWPGGSIQMIMDTWSRLLLYYLIVACLGRGLAGVQSLMSSVAWATAALVLMGLFQPGHAGVRYGIAGSSMDNPNELAAALVLALPFCGWYVLGSGRPKVLRLVLLAVTVCALVMLFRTGSRMGLLVLVSIVIVLLVIVRGKARLLLSGAALAVSLAGIVLTPKAIEQRYETIVDKNVEGAEGNVDVSHANGSSEARWSLLVTSLRVTAQHPVFGVGLGNFQGENASLTKRSGEQVSWQVAHNSYTQISSECGIPGALIYLGLIVYCLRTTNRLRKAMAANPELRAHAPMAFGLFVESVVFALCAMFSSGFAYGFNLPLLAATVLSLERFAGGVLARPATSPT